MSSKIDDEDSTNSPNLSSDTSSFGEYNTCSFSAALGAYSYRSELSLATLVRLLLSMLFLLCSALVRRLSVGDEVGRGCGRSLSMLERLDWRRRGGGGGGGIVEVVLSLETERGLLRVEVMEEVRERPVEVRSGEAGGWEEKVLLRDEGAIGDVAAGRVVDVVRGSSVVDELGLGVLLLFVRDAPCRRAGGGGGGGALLEDGDDVGSYPEPGLSKGNSVECWEDVVSAELLRDRLPVVLDVRSWLCLRARGTGGGAFFWGVPGSG